jgi:D-3-phosphoglycerate dehydrogenase
VSDALPRTEQPNVLLSVSSFGVASDEPMLVLESAGVNIIPNPHGRKLREEEIIDLIPQADALIAGTEPLNANVLASAKRLRVISRVGVGLENVDLNAARELGIAVRNTPEALTDAVAELTLGGMLNVLRHVGHMDREMHEGIWERRMGSLLRDKTVGVIGLGRIGRRLVELLRPFEVRVVAHDRAPDPEVAKQLGVTYVDLDSLLSTADIITLHLPGTTEALIGSREIGLIRPTAILLNASRGGLVDEAALVKALQDKRLAGAYLDTFETEPYDGPLTGLTSVLMTPHAGSYAAEARATMEIEAVQNMLESLKEFGL